MASLYEFCMENENKKYLLDMWDKETNDKFGFTIHNTTSHCNKDRYWKCVEKGHSFKRRVNNAICQTGQCPICSGRQLLSGYNDFETWCNSNGYQSLLEDWDYSNNKYLPSELLPHSNQFINWKCHICNHYWTTKLSNRTCSNHTACPNCHGVPFEDQMIVIKQQCEALAKTCSSRTEMHDKYLYYYKIASKNKWLDEWFPVQKNKSGHYIHKEYWTLERCKEIALKYEYTCDFVANDWNVYQTSRRKGFLKYFTWLKHKKVSLRGTRDIYAYIFPEYHTIYVGLTNGITERDRNHRRSDKKSSVYKFAEEHNISIPSPTVLESNIPDSEAGKMEHFYVEKYRNEGWVILNKAKTGSRSSSLGSTYKKYITREECEEVCKKCETLTDLHKNYSTAYHHIIENKWFDLLDGFTRVQVKSGYWDVYEHCLEIAHQCHSRKEFKLKNVSAYDASHRNSWIDTFDWFEDHSTKGIVCQFNLDGTFVAEFPTAKIAHKTLNIDYNGILYCCEGKQRHAGGFMWKFKKDIEDISTPISPYKHPSAKWTYESCYQVALKYATLADFEKKESGAIQKARKEGWLKDYTWLLPTIKSKPIFQYTLDGTLVRKYANAEECCAINGWTNPSSIRRCCNPKQKQKITQGFIWSYTLLEEANS